MSDYEKSVMSSMPLAGVFLSGAKFKRVIAKQIPIGNNDIYTCPAGKKALIMSQQSTTKFFNTSVGNIGVTVNIKISGVYRQWAGLSTIGAGAGIVSNHLSMLLLAGESFSLITITNNGLNVFLPVIEFDESSPISRGLILDPAIGANTLYTCPVGKSACALFQSFNMNTSQLVGYNNSATPTNFIMHFVPLGDVIGVEHQSGAVATIGANSLFLAQINPHLEAGDFIDFNSSAAPVGLTMMAIMAEKTV